MTTNRMMLDMVNFIHFMVQMVIGMKTNTTISED